MSRNSRNVPWLDKRDGVYYAHWYDAGSRRSRRQSLGTGDAGEAQGRFAAFLTAGADAVLNRPPPARTFTCGQALDDYWREHAMVKVADAKRIEIALVPLRAFFGGAPVADLSFDDARMYHRRRTSGSLGRAVGDGTVRRELGVLRAALHHAVKWSRPGAVRLTIAPSVELPPSPPPRDRWLTHDELGRLLAATEPGPGERLSRLHRFVRVAYYTAARRASIEALTWFQVDLENQTIALNAPGRRQTHKRRPVVPIVGELMPTLRRALQEKRSGFVLDRDDDIHHELRRLLTKIQIHDVSAHTLRHTRAVHLAQDGVDLFAIAGLLGDTMKTVETNYLHHCPQHIRSKIEGRGGPKLHVEDERDEVDLSHSGTYGVVGRYLAR